MLQGAYIQHDDESRMLRAAAMVPCAHELQSAAERAPREILHQIFTHLYPSANALKQYVHHSIFNKFQSRVSSHLLLMRPFLTLRLVSRIWNAVAGAMAYFNLIIRLNSLSCTRLASTHFLCQLLSTLFQSSPISYETFRDPEPPSRKTSAH